jgi:putative Ig domain-containing protein
MSRRLIVVLVAALLTAGIFVSAAAAIAFTDDSCANDSGCRPPHGQVGSSYFHKVQIRPGGGTGPYTYSISAGSLPAGLSIGSSSGEITGTPTAAGTSNFYIDGGDACPGSSSCTNVGDPPPCEPGTPLVDGTCRFPHVSAQRDFTIVIDPGLRIVTNDIPQNATLGQAYSAQLEAQVVTNLNPVTGSPATGAAWTVVSGVGTGLPPGLTVANGLISGTPTAEGAFNFRIQATLNGVSHFQTYSLTVRQPLAVSAARPMATSPAPTLWEVGVPFSSKLTPSGGSGTFTLAIGTGTLPTGVTLGPDGTVSGTPRAAGTYRATVKVTDSEGRSLDYAANFGIAARLKVGTLALKPGKVGRSYRSKVTALGGIAPRKWKITLGPLPKGIRFERTTGILSGIPTKAGRYRLTFQVTDGLKVVASKRLRIDVLP